MKQLYVHIGPFKTGTTALQDYFWAKRHDYRAAGLLYPEAGIHHDAWGHRHFKLAWSFRPELWDKLVQEIEASDCQKILISAERFSQRAAVLDSAADYIRPYNPRMVIFIRNERDLVRSMYLQVVKGSIHDRKEDIASRVSSFSKWWAKNKQRYVYARMIEGWAETYGADSIDFVPYGDRAPNDSISAMCRTIGVEELPRLERLKSNRSIGGFTARVAVAAARFGPEAARVALKAGDRMERKFPRLLSSEVRGFDPEAVVSYYREANRSAAERFPDFGRIYGRIHGDQGAATRSPRSGLAA